MEQRYLCIIFIPTSHNWGETSDLFLHYADSFCLWSLIIQPRSPYSVFDTLFVLSGFEAACFFLLQIWLAFLQKNFRGCIGIIALVTFLASLMKYFSWWGNTLLSVHFSIHVQKVYFCHFQVFDIWLAPIIFCDVLIHFLLFVLGQHGTNPEGAEKELFRMLFDQCVERVVQENDVEIRRSGNDFHPSDVMWIRVFHVVIFSIWRFLEQHCLDFLLTSGFGLRAFRLSWRMWEHGGVSGEKIAERAWRLLLRCLHW